MENINLTCPRCNQSHFYPLYASNATCINCGHLFEDYFSTQKKVLLENHSPFEVLGSTLLKYKGNQSHVVIPSGITEIAFSAFKDCKSLEILTLPESLRIISFSAFENCSNLKTINSAPPLSYIKSCAFKNCTSLINFHFIPGLLEIGCESFANCTQLQGMSLPHSVERVFSQAFENCVSLTHVDILGATHISKDAFNNCINIKTVELYGHLSKGISLSDNSFKDCKNLVSVKADDYDYPIPSMRKAAFNGCSKLHTVSFHNKEIYLRYFSDNDFICYEKHEKLYYMELRREFGKCQYCGGKFRFFNQTCRDCGKKKDY